MKRIVECVPNFSEGRRPEVIDQIVAAMEAVRGTTLLDKEMNADHNRAVVTFVGDPEAAAEAAFRGIARAKDLIDLTHHQGEHPRMGATDVCPFIPIAGVSNEECVALARRLAQRVADELGIPTYLYELAAQRPERTDLAVIRKGGFEGLREAVRTDPARAPDFGPPELHPTAGATVIGVRFPLIAYNVNLASKNVEVAKKIAKALRFKDGGYRYAKALGFEIKEKDCVQVSINMTNYTGTPLFRAFELVKREAERYGVAVTESEIVGLVPQQALIDAAVWYLQLDSFQNEQVLENRLEAGAAGAGIGDFIETLAAPTPTPGGGSAAAVSGAMGTSLFAMVAGLTLGKKGYENVQGEVTELAQALAPLRGRFLALSDEDARSFDAVMSAFKLPKSSDAEKQARSAAIQEATKDAAEVPLRVMRLAVEALERGVRLAAIGNKSSVSDVGVGAGCLLTALKGAHLNVRINLGGLKDHDTVVRLGGAAAELAGKGHVLAATIDAEVNRVLS